MVDALGLVDASLDQAALDATPRDAQVDSALDQAVPDISVDMTADAMPDGRIEPDATPPPVCEGRDVWPAVEFAREGRFMRFIAPAEGVAPRRITVYLPARYDAEPERRYPVLYMHDGQNLFDPREAAFGQVWAVDAALSSLGETIEPIIVVGIDNAGADRIIDYTPSVDPGRGVGGGSAAYGAFLVEQLKPFIDARLRTICEDTGVMGSSLGGLVSLNLWLDYPQVFKRVAAVSPSFWWNGREILDRLDLDWPAGARVWIDGGGAEGADPDRDGRTSVIEDSRAVIEALVAGGAPFPTELGYHEDPTGEHNEPTWRTRLPNMLTYLYGPALAAPPIDLTIRPWAPQVLAQTSFALSVDARWPGVVLTLPHGAPMWMGGPVEAGALIAAPGPVTLTAQWQTRRAEWAVEVQPSAQVEFVVRVPAQPAPDAVYLAGDAFTLGTWDPAGVSLQREGDTWRGTVPMAAGTPYRFKLTRGGWDTVEKGPNGEEIQDRQGVAADGRVEIDVARWADSR
jgi:predicted alpha/beta superfamily hydrolase